MCEAVRMQRGGAGGVQGCMACAGDACKCAAGKNDARRGEILCARGPAHHKRSRGLLLSTMCRRRHLDARDQLIVIRVDEQDVKKP